MKMRTLRCFLISFISFLFSAGTLSFAQTANVDDTTSTPTEGVGHDYIHLLSETVNPANGSVSLRIELPTPNGRGIGLPFAITYDSNSVNHLMPGFYPSFGTVGWSPNTGNLSQGGWRYSVPAAGAIGSSPTEGDYPNFYTCYVSSNYIFHDPSGGVHALGLGTSQATYTGTTADCQEYPVAAGGDQKFYAVLPWPNYSPNYPTTPPGAAPLSVYSDDGTVYQFNTLAEGNGNTEVLSLPNYIEDRNGNRIVSSSSGSGSSFAFSFTDTLGRTLISSNGFGPSGTTNTLSVANLTYQITWKTTSVNFSTPSTPIQQAGTCYPIPKAVNSPTVISQITLPNQKAYTFYYGTDATPHGAGTNPYGLLSEIDYPSGAWVVYTWKLSDTLNEMTDYPGWENKGAGACSADPAAICPAPVQDGCIYQYKTPVVASRQVFPGGSSTPSLTQTFTYSTTWASSGIYSGIYWIQKNTNLTTQDNVLGLSSLTSYSYTPVYLSNPPYSSTTLYPQVPVESSISYYDWGSSKLLRTVNKAWYDQYDIASEQTVLDTGISSQVIYCYVGTKCAPSPILSQLQERDEYDYGASTPSRKTITNYQSFSGTPGFIMDKPCQTVVYSVVN